jgi:hypothetical protein
VGGNLELRTEKGDKIQKLKSKKKKKNKQSRVGTGSHEDDNQK